MSDVEPRAGGRALPAAILALGLVAAATVFGAFLYSSRARHDTVETVGAATRRFDSDIVKWRITLGRRVSPQQLRGGYAEMKGDVDRLVERFRAQGLPDSAVSLQPPNANPIFDRSGELTAYQVNQSLFVVSDDIDRVEGWALDPGDLLAAGLVLEGSQLEYYYAALDGIKRDLLAAATRDARARAERIAGSSDRHAGRLVDARAGVFQITEPYSTEVAAYGIHNTGTRRKEITVTVHASFTLD